MSLAPIDLVSAHPWQRATFTTYALSLSFFEAVILDALIRGGGKQAFILADVQGLRASLSEQGAQRVGKDYEVEPVAVSSGKSAFHPKIRSSPTRTNAICGGNVEACVVRVQRDRAAGWTFVASEPPELQAALEDETDKEEKRVSCAPFLTRRNYAVKSLRPRCGAPCPCSIFSPPERSCWGRRRYPRMAGSRSARRCSNRNPCSAAAS